VKTIAQQLAVILINGVNLHADVNALNLVFAEEKEDFLTSKVAPANVFQENAHNMDIIGIQENVFVKELFIGAFYQIKKHKYAKKMEVYNAYKESGNIVDAIKKNDLIIEYI
jgi:hypothetical protein